MRGKKFWSYELGEQWAMILKDTLNTIYADKLINYMYAECDASNVFSIDYEDTFLGFKMCPWDKVKIVIIGEEFRNIVGRPSKAFGHSLLHSFGDTTLEMIQSCIYRNYHSDDYINSLLDFDYSLKFWTDQGILILNQNITKNIENNSIDKRPWNKIIIGVLEALNKHKQGTIILLWGKDTKRFLPLIEKYQHVFCWEHPQEAFKASKDWNCPNFKQANQMINYLNGKEEEIIW